MVVLGVYRHGTSFVLKFLRESTFLRMGPSGPPLCTNGSRSAKYLMHLSIKVLFCCYNCIVITCSLIQIRLLMATTLFGIFRNVSIYHDNRDNQDTTLQKAAHRTLNEYIEMTWLYLLYS